MTAQAVMTSTHGHPRLTWPAVAKVNRSLSPSLFLFSLYIYKWPMMLLKYIRLIQITCG